MFFGFPGDPKSKFRLTVWGTPGPEGVLFKGVVMTKLLKSVTANFFTKLEVISRFPKVCHIDILLVVSRPVVMLFGVEKGWQLTSILVFFCSVYLFGSLKKGWLRGFFSCDEKLRKCGLKVDGTRHGSTLPNAHFFWSNYFRDLTRVPHLKR